MGQTSWLAHWEQKVGGQLPNRLRRHCKYVNKQISVHSAYNEENKWQIQNRLEPHVITSLTTHDGRRSVTCQKHSFFFTNPSHCRLSEPLDWSLGLCDYFIVSFCSSIAVTFVMLMSCSRPHWPLSAFEYMLNRHIYHIIFYFSTRAVVMFRSIEIQI